MHSSMQTVSSSANSFFPAFNGFSSCIMSLFGDAES